MVGYAFLVKLGCKGGHMHTSIHIYIHTSIHTYMRSYLLKDVG